MTGGSAEPAPAAAPRGESLRALALLFLKLGTIGFGGPAAHVALMEDEVVTRRRWMSHAEFLDIVSAANLIPGPNSTEIAIHVGWRRAGWRGVIVAGASFIVPAALIVAAIAAAYVHYGSLPAVGGVLAGVKPVVIAVVLQALFRLGHTALKSPMLAAIGAGGIVATACGVDELLVLAAAALVVQTRVPSSTPTPTPPPPPASPPAPCFPFVVVPAGATAAATGAVLAAVATPVGLAPLFFAFLRIGSVLFGSGYVLMAFLRAEFVQKLGWLTEAQIVDATAVGLVTPGPVFTSATFVGWLVAGPAGAVVATVGIFLPAFVFVALSAPLLPRLRRARRVGAALDSLNAASWALMVVIAWQLGGVSLIDAPSVMIAAASLVALVRFRMGAPWLVLAGGIAGLALHGW